MMNQSYRPRLTGEQLEQWRTFTALQRGYAELRELFNQRANGGELRRIAVPQCAWCKDMQFVYAPRPDTDGKRIKVIMVRCPWCNGVTA